MGLHNDVEATRKLSQEEVHDLVVDCIQDMKGKNIVKLDLRALDEAPTDFFIICSGSSTTQVKAISDNIYKRLKQEQRTLPLHVEGQQNSQWILLDYFDLVVHIFHPETREYYELEDLWSDAKTTEYQDL